MNIKETLTNVFPYGTTEYARKPISRLLMLNEEVVSTEGIFSIFKKNKKPDFHSKDFPELGPENRKKITNTYLNDSWLKKQKYREGVVDLAPLSQILCVNGSAPATSKDLVATLKKTVNELDSQTKAHYARIKGLTSRAPKTLSAIVEGELDKDSFENVKGEMKHFEKREAYKFKLTSGNADGKKADPYKPNLLTDYLQDEYETEIPTLNASECKEVAGIIISLFSQIDSEVSEHVYPIWFEWFGPPNNGVGSVKSKASNGSGWSDLLDKLDDYINFGYSPFTYYRMGLIKALSALIDKSIK